jgi:hypothetical protein
MTSFCTFSSFCRHFYNAPVLELHDETLSQANNSFELSTIFLSKFLSGLSEIGFVSTAPAGWLPLPGGVAALDFNWDPVPRRPETSPPAPLSART